MKTVAIPQATSKGYVECCEGGCFDASYPTSKFRRGRVQMGGNITPTLTTAGISGINIVEKIMEDTVTARPEGKGWVWDPINERWFRVRKLTARECFRLMDVPEAVIDRLMAVETRIRTKKKGQAEVVTVQVISNSQLYKMAGNSIVVAPMALTFENLFFPKDEKHKKGDQLCLFDD